MDGNHTAVPISSGNITMTIHIHTDFFPYLST
jgi:hypothetical protein